MAMLRNNDFINSSRYTCRTRRLASLENKVVSSLADDQKLFAEGIIMTYQTLANTHNLTKLEKQRYISSVELAMAAPPILALISKKNKEGNNKNYEELDVLNALCLLNELDTAIAWCEGKMMVTTQLFPPVVGIQTQQINSLSHECNKKLNQKGVSFHSEVISSQCQESHEIFHLMDIPKNYYENLDVNVQSRNHSRSRIWQTDISLPSPSYIFNSGLGEVETSGCNLDFDRWTARQISLQAEYDKKRLWRLRCIAEETIRRHTIIIEERLHRITMLITEREEVTAGVLVEFSPCEGVETQDTILQIQNNNKKNLQVTQKGIIGSNIISINKKKIEKFEEVTHKQLQDISSVIYDKEEEKVEQKRLNNSSVTKEVETLISEPCVACVRFSLFAYNLLCESEKIQRYHIEQEVQLSLQLLNAQWQSLLNHLNNKRLISAKEGLIHELATNLNELSRSITSQGISPFISRNREIISNSLQNSKNQTPLNIYRTWSVEAACSRSASSQEISIPPPRQSAKPFQINYKLLNNGNPYSKLNQYNEGNVMQQSDILSLIDRTSLYESSPTILQKNMRKTENSTVKDIALHICMSLECVERKQVALTEEREWGELITLYNKE